MSMIKGRAAFGCGGSTTRGGTSRGPQVSKAVDAFLAGYALIPKLLFAPGRRCHHVRGQPVFIAQPQPATSRRRWTTIASIGIQAVIAGGVLMVPLLTPAALPMLSTAPATIQFAHQPPPVPPKPMVVNLAASTSSAISAPSQPTIELVHGTMSSRSAPASDDGPAPLLAMNGSMGTGTGISSIAGTGGGYGPSVTAAGGGARTGAPVRISSGVSAGMLLMTIKPVYPRIAIAARQQGTVVLSAIIDKNGKITALQAISGPEMLRGAALDARASGTLSAVPAKRRAD